MEFNRAYDPIRALQASWKALAQAPLPLILGGVLLLLTWSDSGGGSHGVSLVEHDGGSLLSGWHLMLLPLLGVCACVGIALFLFSSWLQVGFANTVEEVLRTGHTEVGHLFEARGRFGSMVLSRILFLIVAFLGVVPFIVLFGIAALATHGFDRHHPLILIILVPGFLIWFPAFIYVMLGIWLAPQAVALEGLQPVESLKRSWSLVSGNRLMLFLYWIVTFLFTIFGLCLCFFGFFVTGTMAFTARSESYLALVRGSERDGWWIEHGATPPPTPPPGWGAPPASTPPANPTA
jgi:hypothetical protein